MAVFAKTVLAKILAVTQHKGGVGKTTASVHGAFYQAEKGNRVLYIDTDPQRNGSLTLAKFKSNVATIQLYGDNCPAPVTVDGQLITLIYAEPSLTDLDVGTKEEIQGRLRAFKQNVEAMASQFDVIIIDTGPSAGLRLTSALLVADYVLTPIVMEYYSVEGIGMMLKMITNIRNKMNKKMVFLGMLPSIYDTHSHDQKKLFAKVKKDHSALLVDGVLVKRSSVALALQAGVPVWKVKRTSAREAGKEMREVLGNIFAKMGIK